MALNQEPSGVSSVSAEIINKGTIEKNYSANPSAASQEKNLRAIMGPDGLIDKFPRAFLPNEDGSLVHFDNDALPFLVIKPYETNATMTVVDQFGFAQIYSCVKDINEPTGKKLELLIPEDLTEGELKKIHSHCVNVLITGELPFNPDDSTYDFRGIGILEEMLVEANKK